MNDISLRFYEKGDEEILFRDYLGDVSSSTYLARETHESPGQTAQMLEKLSLSSSFDKYGKVVLVIQSTHREHACGIITLVKVDDQIELHFGICKSCRRQGIATSAVKAAVSYIQEVLGHNEVCSYPDLDNVGAQRVLKNCGFHCVGPRLQFYNAPQLGDQLRDAGEFRLCV